MLSKEWLKYIIIVSLIILCMCVYLEFHVRKAQYLLVDLFNIFHFSSKAFNKATSTSKSCEAAKKTREEGGSEKRLQASESETP